MVIKACALREGALAEVARAVREQGKGAIYVASEILEQKRGVIRREVRIPQPPRPARARGRALRAHGEPLPLAGDRRPRRARDGRQVDPRHPAARGLAGHAASSSPSRGPTSRRPWPRWSSWSRAASGRKREHAARHGRLSGHRRRSRAGDGARRGADLPPGPALGGGGRGRGRAPGAALRGVARPAARPSRSGCSARWARRTPTSSTPTC